MAPQEHSESAIHAGDSSFQALASDLRLSMAYAKCVGCWHDQIPTPAEMTGENLRALYRQAYDRAFDLTERHRRTMKENWGCIGELLANIHMVLGIAVRRKTFEEETLLSKPEREQVTVLRRIGTLAVATALALEREMKEQHQAQAPDQEATLNMIEERTGGCGGPSPAPKTPLE